MAINDCIWITSQFLNFIISLTTFCWETIKIIHVINHFRSVKENFMRRLNENHNLYDNSSKTEIIHQIEKRKSSIFHKKNLCWRGVL